MTLPARTEALLESIDVARSKGLEFGPLANPVVRREMGEIRYLDHVDTDSLRARYATHQGFDIDAIVPIDYVMDGGTIADVVEADLPFDYAIASHVIEHVPDLVGWLGEVHDVLRVGGVLSLAIPDHRKCFDALRSPTVVADVIHAHLTKATVPTPRQVFDHYSCAVAWRGLISWEVEPPFGELTLIHSEPEALERATDVLGSGEYLDVHCWTFTPSSFRHLFAALAGLQLVPFALERCSETVNGEFFAALRALPDGAAAPPRTHEASPSLPPPASEHARLRARLHDTETALAELQFQHSWKSWKVVQPLRMLNRRRLQWQRSAAGRLRR